MNNFYSLCGTFDFHSFSCLYERVRPNGCFLSAFKAFDRFFRRWSSHFKRKKKLYCITEKKITVNTLKNSSSPNLNRQLRKAPQGDHLFYAMLFLIYIWYCYVLKKSDATRLCVGAWWGIMRYTTELLLGIQIESWGGSWCRRTEES